MNNRNKTKISLWLEKCLTLYAKEAMHYFHTPSAYVIIVVFLLISGYLFATALFLNNQATIAAFSEIAPLLFTFFVPAITMKLFAEEYKTGTIEILFTNPVTITQIMIAKLASAMTVIVSTLFLTLVYPVTVSFLGNIDLSSVWCGYGGLFLTCLVFGSAGIFASSITKNQITAFIIGFMICFVLYLIGKMTVFMPSQIAGVVNFIGIDAHLDNLSRGVIDTRDIFYYLSVSSFFMFLVYAKLNISKTG